MTSYVGLQPEPLGGLSVEHRSRKVLDPTFVPEVGIRAVSLTEAKLRLRVDTSSEDNDITLSLDAAISWCQQYTNRQFIRAGYIVTLDDFPRGPIVLDAAPLVSITTLKYVNTAGTLTTWASSNYTVDIASEPGRVFPAYGIDWPEIREPGAAVQVQYVCGYGTATTDVPNDIRAAILTLTATLYRNREVWETSGYAGMTNPIRLTLESLLSPYVVYRPAL